MPSNWLAVDSNFPTFTGGEKTEEQIRSLQNYLYILKEQLQYSLQNLTADNWNASALENLTDDATKKLSARIDALVSQVKKVEDQLNRETGAEELSEVKEQVKALTQRVEALDEANLPEKLKELEQRIQVLDEANLPGKLEELEQRIQVLDEANLPEKLKELEQRIQELDEANLPGRLEKLESRMQIIEKNLQEEMDGSITLGQPGQRLNLVGDIYVNGLQIAITEEGETVDETT